ncbi:nucleoside deaminase [Paenibacillus sp. LMG 31456]|uniref:Nucleoside deaminase n=1 Tax=Paenibacillus foliorum TaxID=2654974 RepID=A0A972K0G5_9BACL|nr:nucleoside deaminase [Paenibacillus foliorum]NOU94641.1 nucleoside deaminase [Paenibacillus foliorum]
MKHTETFIQRAVDIAYENTKIDHGKPFGAVIVKDGKIIAEGVNEVLALHDPTAHAEMQAIRKASELLQTSDLSDCELYASGEPCPMCMGAIYWAKFKEVYHAFTEEEAARIGMSTRYVYEQLALPSEERAIKLIRLSREGSKHPYTLWAERSR